MVAPKPTPLGWIVILASVVVAVALIWRGQ